MASTIGSRLGPYEILSLLGTGLRGEVYPPHVSGRNERNETNINAPVTGRALEYAHAFKPSVFMPAHHDAARDGLWRATEPIFQALKDENPHLVTVSRGYREPVCFDVRVRKPRAGN